MTTTSKWRQGLSVESSASAGPCAAAKPVEEVGRPQRCRLLVLLITDAVSIVALCDARFEQGRERFARLGVPRSASEPFVFRRRKNDRKRKQTRFGERWWCSTPFSISIYAVRHCSGKLLARGEDSTANQTNKRQGNCQYNRSRVSGGLCNDELRPPVKTRRVP